jgi:hypothetical protein
LSRSIPEKRQVTGGKKDVPCRKRTGKGEEGRRRNYERGSVGVWWYRGGPLANRGGTRRRQGFVGQAAYDTLKPATSGCRSWNRCSCFQSGNKGAENAIGVACVKNQLTRLFTKMLISPRLYQGGRRNKQARLRPRLNAERLLLAKKFRSSGPTCVPNAERRTPNRERRTVNAERRTPNAERQSPKPP